MSMDDAIPQTGTAMPLKFRCPGCATESALDDGVLQTGNFHAVSLVGFCSQCGAEIQFHRHDLRLRDLVRRMIDGRGRGERGGRGGRNGKVDDGRVMT